MASTSKPAAPGEAQQVFRQFAWNIAGTLSGQKTTSPAARKPRGPSRSGTPGGQSQAGKAGSK